MVNRKDLNISWVGRLCDFKVYILKYTIEKLAELAEKQKKNGQLRVNENIGPLTITVTEAPLNITEDVYHEHLSNLMDFVQPLNSAIKMKIPRYV